MIEFLHPTLKSVLKSIPITKIAPVNPKKTPIHCLKIIFSSRKARLNKSTKMIRKIIDSNNIYIVSL